VIKKVSKEEKAFHYRCPACHYLVEKDVLFAQCCPICGWISPLVMSRKLDAGENSLHVDVTEEEDIIRITTELHMVDDNIRLDVIEKTYRNGVLEVQLRKAGR